jgi:hypothetical protein
MKELHLQGTPSFLFRFNELHLKTEESKYHGIRKKGEA